MITVSQHESSRKYRKCLSRCKVPVFERAFRFDSTDLSESYNERKSHVRLTQKYVPTIHLILTVMHHTERAQQNQCRYDLTAHVEQREHGHRKFRLTSEKRPHTPSKKCDDEKWKRYIRRGREHLSIYLSTSIYVLRLLLFFNASKRLSLSTK